jgi:hypothetical protein
MADNNNTKDQIAQMEAQTAKFEQLSQRFADYAEKNKDKFTESAKTMATVYEKIAEEQANSVEMMQEMAEIQAEINKKAKELETADEKHAVSLKKEIKELEFKNKEKLKSLETSQKEIKVIQEQVKELAKVKTSVTELEKQIGETANAWMQHLRSADALIGGFKGIAKAAQDFADIQIQSSSYKGMTGDVLKDVQTVATEGTKLSANLTLAQVKLAYFGYTAEEAGETFRKFSNLSLDPQRIEQMTSATGALAKMLGVSLSEATQYVSDQQLKYGQTAEQSAHSLKAVFDQTKKYNTEAGMQVMRGRDVVKVMFDLSRESKAVVQDQNAIERMLSTNLLRLQAQGQNYEEALAGASMYVKKMTAEAPEWTKILSGRDLLAQMEKLGDLSGEGASQAAKEMIEQLNAASPELAKRVQDIKTQIKTGAVDRYSGERMMQELLQGTEVGMEAMEKEFAHVASMGVQAVKSVYGVSELEAKRMMDQNAAAVKKRDALKDMDNPAKRKAALDKLNLSEKERNFLMSEQLTHQQRLEFLQNKDAENSLRQIVEQRKAKEDLRARDIKTWQERIQRYKSEGREDLAKAAQEQLVKIQGEPLQGITDQLSNDSRGVMQFLGGNFINQIKTIVGSPLGQIAVGIGSLALGAFDKAAKLAQINYLRQIAFNTSSGSGGGDGLGNLLGKGKDLLKGGVGKFSKAGKFVKMGAPALAAIGVGAAEYLSADTDKEKNEALGGAAGGIAGSVVGGILGSLVPVVGTAVGATVGGFVGDYLGRKGSELFASNVPKGSVSNTPINASPALNPAYMPGTGIQGGLSGMFANAAIVPGAQGSNIDLTIRLPYAQTLSENLQTMNRFSVLAPQ